MVKFIGYNLVARIWIQQVDLNNFNSNFDFDCIIEYNFNLKILDNNNLATNFKIM